jgi:hypothetical protein
MSSSSQDRIYNLALARSAEALKLATIALMIADPSTEPKYGFIVFGGGSDSLRGTSEQIEAQSCALWRLAGMSWDAIAGYYEVSKQSLHRRMSRQSDLELDRAQVNVEINEQDIEYSLEILSVFSDDILANFYRDLEQFPARWEALRKQHGWWREQ